MPPNKALFVYLGFYLTVKLLREPKSENSKDHKNKFLQVLENFAESVREELSGNQISRIKLFFEDLKNCEKKNFI